MKKWFTVPVVGGLLACIVGLSLAAYAVTNAPGPVRNPYKPDIFYQDSSPGVAIPGSIWFNTESNKVYVYKGDFTNSVWGVLTNFGDVVNF